MYRIVTLAVLDAGVDPDRCRRRGRTVAAVDVRHRRPTPDRQHHRLAGPGRHQRDPRLSRSLSRSPRCRRTQRCGPTCWTGNAAGARSGRMVVEGRDIGTVVVPDARLKIYLTADAAERARRRHRQNAGVAARSGGIGRCHRRSRRGGAGSAPSRHQGQHPGRMPRCRPPRTRGASTHRSWRSTRPSPGCWRWPASEESGEVVHTSAARRIRPRRPADPRAWTAGRRIGIALSAADVPDADRGHGAGCRPPGPLVVVANHQNFMDGAVLFGALTRRVSFLVKAEAVKGPLGWLLINVGQYALLRGVPDREPLLKALAQLQGRRCDRHLPGGHPRRRHGRDRVRRRRLAGGPVRRHRCPGRDPRDRSAGRAARRRRFRPPVHVLVGEPFAVREGRRPEGGRRGDRGRSAVHLAALVATLDAEIDNGRRRP